MSAETDARPAHLEWWANDSTCLFRIAVRVTPAPVGDTWLADPVPGPGAEERDGLEFLIGADPVFTLRFTDTDTDTDAEAAEVIEVALERGEARAPDFRHLRLSRL